MHVYRTKSTLHKTKKVAAKYIANFLYTLYKLYRKSRSDFTKFRDLGAVMISFRCSRHRGLHCKHQPTTASNHPLKLYTSAFEILFSWPKEIVI